MKDNYYFNDEYFLGVEFTTGPADVGIPLVWRRADAFAEVLEVCGEHGLGIAVIEVYKGGYAETRLVDDFGGDAFDREWFRTSFEELRNEYRDDGGKEVLFAATYLEPADTWPPEHLLPARSSGGFWQRLKNVFR